MQPHLTSKPPTRKERMAMKAKERSRRNSPPGQPTKAQAKAERKHKTGNRKMRQSARRAIAAMTGISDEMKNLNDSALEAADAIKEATPGLDVLGHPRLNELTVAQLRELAKDRGVKTTTKMRKQEIIDLIEDLDRDE